MRFFLVLLRLYLLGRYLDSQQRLTEMCLSLDHPSWLHSPPSSFLVEGDSVMPAPHSSPDCQVPKMCQNSFRAGGKHSTASVMEWACIPTPYSFQFYFCFHLFYFLYCWSSARSNSRISCFCSCTAAGYTRHGDRTGHLVSSSLPWGVMWNCTFILQLHNHHQLTPPGNEKAQCWWTQVQGGVTGKWWAQLELLMKLESKWRPGTFQGVKYCCALMTDQTAKTKSRDCHWKHSCWGTVIWSLWKIKMRQAEQISCLL